MDYFKVFTIIFMIIITYLLYNIYCDKIKENFAEAEQSIGGVDDTNSINTLAQLARKLLDGGATVPGNLTIKGELVSSGSLTSAGITTGGITSATITSSGDIITKGNATIGGNQTITGNLSVKGAVVIDGDLTVTGHLIVKKGSDFSGGRHHFTDEEANTSGGSLRVGTVYGKPGIWHESGGDDFVQIGPFTAGTQTAGNNNTGGMVPDKNYNFLRARDDSYAILNKNNTGNLGMAWNNGELYWTYLTRNQRDWNSDVGHLRN